MRSDQQGYFFTLLDPEFFESLDSYTPTAELREIVEAHTGDGWTISPRGFWTVCTPAEAVLGAQGWKIHLSATWATAEETLRRAVPVLAAARVPFKFASDLRMVDLCTTKNWPRTGAGKFVTVYPPDEAAFVALAERLHQATADLRGPYLLSDRPYRDSKVVFYRYGEHRSAGEVDAMGRPAPVLVGPDGTRVSDARKPCFWLPPWVKDPFEGDAPALPQAGPVVLNGRYRVTGALRYSSMGGIYEAEDLQTGRAVIVREARPMVADRGERLDAQAVLEKEARILRRLAPTGYVPEFVELFREWEHLFLVQEKLEAQILWTYALEGSHGFSLAALPSPAALFEWLRSIVRNLVRGLAAVHARGVVLRDFTKNNVLVTRDHRFKFIDFELAYEADGSERPVIGWTAGYASPQQQANRAPTPADDHYALGALLLDILSFNAAGYPLNPGGVLRSLDLLLDDVGLPRVFHDVVVGLLEPDPERRWTPERALAALDAVQGLSTTPPAVVESGGIPDREPPSEALRAEAAEAVRGIVRYLEAVPDYTRRDRLWPASAEVFLTNPVGVQFGAAGPAWFLHRATGRAPEGALRWIADAARRQAVPPSLYNGLGGAALLLLESGKADEAHALLGRADARLAMALPELYHGAAGWGLTHLHFWRRTGEARHLERAVEAGEHLLRTAQSDPAGAYWENDAGHAVHGLGHGQAGVALFLTCLNAAAPGSEWLALAEKALDFEFAHAERIDGRLLWIERRGLKVGPRLPHMRYGSAGVGTAALRYWLATGDDRFRRLADECAHAVANRHSNKLWQDYGLAGYGEYLLDLHRFTGDARYLDNAWHLVPAILAARIERPQGVAFAGLEHLRICCDFGMGTAGIGSFLHRLLHPSVPRLLLADELLRPEAAEVEPKAAEATPAAGVPA
jgi:tRNA A-37 threonylcarbamoyl transferase component Bud32